MHLLRQLSIKSESLNSTVQGSARKEIVNDLTSISPKIKLLYVTPETLATGSFIKIVEKMVKGTGTLSRMIVDEVSLACLSFILSSL